MYRTGAAVQFHQGDGAEGEVTMAEDAFVLLGWLLLFGATCFFVAGILKLARWLFQ